MSFRRARSPLPPKITTLHGVGSRPDSIPAVRGFWATGSSAIRAPFAAALGARRNQRSAPAFASPERSHRSGLGQEHGMGRAKEESGIHHARDGADRPIE